MKQRKLKLYFYALLAAVLLWLSWPPLPFFFLIFFSLVPFLWIEKEIAEHEAAGTVLKFFLPLYFGLVLWNLLTTWWIAKSTLAGAIFALTVNPLLMSFPFLFFHLTKKYSGETTGYLSLIIYYLAFEYLHLQWEFAWPWLNLGNGFAKFPLLFQWYEYTGTLGGTFWVLSVNILIFRGIISRQRFPLQLLKPALAIMIPIIISIAIYLSYQGHGKNVKAAIVQPNIDPYEIPDPYNSEENLRLLLDLSRQSLPDSLDYIIWPEASFPDEIWLNKPEASEVFREVRNFVNEQRVNLVTGALTLKEYKTGATATAKHFTGGECCYDEFNSALQISPNQKLQVYHKSKLVPGVERIPYPALFRIMEPWATYLGGISGSLGVQQQRSVFISADSLKIAPVICYESVFGEYVTEYIREGAQAIFIITNDGWWGNTPGYRQHLAYASLRAVENRKSIARAANNGISCFINQRGDIFQATDFNTCSVISGSISLNNDRTFYSVHGDFFGRISGILSVLLLLTTFVKKRKSRL